MKILIVEDEAYSRQSLTKQLREMDDRHSFHIMECADGRQGWALFEREKPELVFSDIKMPFMSGLELLKRIMVSRPETKVIIVSGFSDFEFARNALNDGAMGYLLKPVSEADLTQLMNRYFTSSTEQKALAPVSREDALTRHLCRTLIQGRHAPDFTQDGIFLKVFDRYRYLEIMFSGDHYPEPESFTECLSHTLGRIPHTGFRLLQFSRKNWGIVLKANVNFLEVIGNLEQLLDSEGYAYAAGISEEATGCEKLVGMRKQAVIALKSRIFGMHAVCFHAEAVKTHVKSISLPETRYGMFKVCVERGDAANAVMRLEKAANELLDNPRIAVGSIEHFLVRITSILRDAYDKSHPEKEGAQPLPFEISLLDCPDRRILLDSLRNLVRLVCTRICESRSDMQSSVVDSVLRYIDDNYNKEISLKELAENVFFLNHTYLSHLISEKTGRSYSSYLRKIRIDKAKESLENPDLSISDVASLSGYNDTSQFIQVFKKDVGLTPFRYKQLHAHLRGGQGEG